MVHLPVPIHEGVSAESPLIKKYRMRLGLIEYLVQIVPVRLAYSDRLAYKMLTKRTMPFWRLDMPRMHDEARLYEYRHSRVEMHSGQATPDPGADVSVVTDDHQQGDADPPQPACGDGFRQRCKPCIHSEQDRGHE